jgi:hypothetical protein
MKTEQLGLTIVGAVEPPKEEVIGQMTQGNR